MRIALVYDAVYPNVLGGAERRYYEIARRLADAHELTFVSYAWWADGRPPIEHENVHYRSVGPARALYAADGTRRAGEALHFGMATARTLAQLDVDLVDCMSFPYFPVLAARAVLAARRIPLVVTWLEYWGSYWRRYWGLRGAAGRVVENAAAAATPFSVAISDFTAARLRDSPWLRQSVPIRTIPNGVDLAAIDELAPAGPASDLVYVGRLIDHKRLDLVIDAIALLAGRGRRLRLRIVGDGPARAELGARAAAVGVEALVRFDGRLATPAVYGSIKASRLLVLASAREGFGNVVIEANACGRPVVVAAWPDSAAPLLVVDGVTGSIVSPDVGALADAIDRWVTAEEASTARECRAHAATFDWDCVASATADAWAEAAGRNDDVASARPTRSV